MRGLFYLVAAALAASPAVASDKTDAMATVHQFFDLLDKGDFKGAYAACASPASVLDDIPPHAWSGPTACADWGNDFGTDAKAKGITEPDVKLGKPSHVDIDGNRAYVVDPGTYTYKQHDKPMTEPGVFTAALQKTADGWRIVGWAWAKK